ncbi:hypothetical protein EIN_034180 [Entamoeba invadens IP1]|uniref:Uncharacterized protein n=1 Tax=Entamoeba invadens IP1 TaxID=370355 RepID=A0A0A1TYB1_ENTIV|nr:hypothetical protein EIN_034180 [Entamoeba invadens IP1]ELP86507.1 hypothetical protein EIN_034180 [Entamoeba invadens IP1]|eukprot:XP_004185853.1 hypothetical protein EIN_034180 [Entamoeba invadens IP1]
MEDKSLSSISFDDGSVDGLPPSTNQLQNDQSVLWKKRDKDLEPKRITIKKIRRKDEASEDMRKMIRNMKTRGFSIKEICILTDLTKDVVIKYIPDLLNDEKICTEQIDAHHTKRGRKKSDNIELQSKIQDCFDEDNSMTLRNMKEKLKEDGIEISVSYLSKTIKKMGIRHDKKTVMTPQTVRNSNEQQQMFQTITESVFVSPPHQNNTRPPPLL